MATLSNFLDAKANSTKGLKTISDEKKMKELPTAGTSYDLFSRLRKISPQLFALDRKPLLPKEYLFPTEAIAQILGKQLSIEVQVAFDDKNWQQTQDLTKEITAKKLRILGCTLFGLNSSCFLLLPQDLHASLMASLLHISLQQSQEQDESFLKAFETFFLAHVVSAGKQATQEQEGNPRLIEQNTLAECEGHFVYRYRITIGTATFPLIVALPPQFIDDLSKLSSKTQITPEILANIPVLPISIEAARSYCSLATLKSLRTGDLFLVDHPFFIPGSERARVILTYRGVPLFRAKVKNGVLKLLEMSYNQQAFRSLTPITTRVSPMNDNTPQNPLPDEEDFEEISNQTESSSHEETVNTAPHAQPLAIHDLPLLVCIQLKELSMTIEQLSSLQPGNLLDLDIHPEQSTVQLIVEGHAIAEGDLIAIGDKMGVRIRSIGTA